MDNRVAISFTVSGDFDLMLMVEAPRLDDIDAVLDEILSIPGVERCRSWVILGKQFQRGPSLDGSSRPAPEPGL